MNNALKVADINLHIVLFLHQTKDLETVREKSINNRICVHKNIDIYKQHYSEKLTLATRDRCVLKRLVKDIVD